MWDPWALPGLLAAGFAVVMGLVVLLASPGRTVNRLLALVLLLDGLWIVTGLSVAPVIGGTPASQWGLFAAHFVVAPILAASYLAFAARALHTPLLRPLRSKGATAALLAFGAAGAVGVFAFTERFGHSSRVEGHWFFRTITEPGPLLPVVQVGVAVVLLYCIVAAADAWRRAGGPERRRASRAYFWAFGTRDVAWVGALAFIVASGADASPGAGLFWVAMATTAAGVLYVPILAYGILKAQVLDIDLKIKWTISRGTVAAAFVAVFFVVSEAAQQFFAGTRLGPWLGLAAAGLLVFALAPLQRIADRVSDRAMPQVRDTAEYRTVRKREVYRAAVEGALQDGVITDRERDILARLQDELGLSSPDARAIERDASATRAEGVA